MSKILNTKVAGVTFEGRQALIAQLTGREPCRLVPEPDNKFDPNAIAVHVAPLSRLNPTPLSHDDPNGIESQQNAPVIWHIGFIPKELAAQIAPFLEGESLMVEIAEITGGFEIDEYETAAFGVRLRIELPTEAQS